MSDYDVRLLSTGYNILLEEAPTGITRPYLVGSGSLGDTGVSPWSVTTPLPSDLQVSDILVWSIIVGAAATQTWTTSSGWNYIADEQGTNLCTLWAWRRVDGTEVEPQITASVGGGVLGSVIYQFRNVTTASVPYISASTKSQTLSTYASSSAITATHPSQSIFCFINNEDDTGTNTGYGINGWVEKSIQSSTTGTDYKLALVETGSFTVGTEIPSDGCFYQGTTTSEYYTSLTLAFLPLGMSGPVQAMSYSQSFEETFSVTESLSYSILAPPTGITASVVLNVASDISTGSNTYGMVLRPNGELWLYEAVET